MVFDVRPAEVDEAPLAGEDPVDLVRRLALAKAEAGLAAAAEPDVVVLAADTVVVLDGAVLGKPFSSFIAIHLRHVEVHQDEVGIASVLDHLYHFGTVGCFCNNGEFIEIADEVTEGIP